MESASRDHLGYWYQQKYQRRSLLMPPSFFFFFWIAGGHPPGRGLRYRQLWQTSGRIPYSPLLHSLVLIVSLTLIMNLDLLGLPSFPPPSLPTQSSEGLAQFVASTHFSGFQIAMLMLPTHSGSSPALGHCSSLTLPSLFQGRAENVGSESCSLALRMPQCNQEFKTHICETIDNNSKTACKQSGCKEWKRKEAESVKEFNIYVYTTKRKISS